MGNKQYIEIVHGGNFNNLEKFLSAVSGGQYILRVLDKYGQKGVEALAAATPVDTGKTAASWSYEKVVENGTAKLIWSNSNIYRGINIAVLLQYGHATKSGTYVEGIDYINPALRPVFEKLADEAWMEVTKA